MIKLSKDIIDSYVGNVLPLRLISDENLENADIKWFVDGDAVSIRSYADDDEHPFRDGILLRFNKVGKAKVSASYCGSVYTADISVREMKHSSSDDELNYYRGDLHTHTTGIHKHDVFINRTEEFQHEMVDFIKREDLLDFGVMTDHADVSSQYELFRCYAAVEDAEPMRTVLFPGCESDNLIMKTDMVGRQYRAAGEVVVINADYNKTANSWEDLTDAFKEAPCPIGIFAHPSQAAWRFEFNQHGHKPEVVKLMRCVEMGDGNTKSCSLLHEYAFSLALDAGFRVTTSCGSDGHRTRGFKICPGKTVVMASDGSKESITDALRSNRAYASESGNVKLRVRVNGKCVPCDLKPTDKYTFEVNVSYFEEKENTKIVKCQILSDGGKVVGELCDIRSDSFEMKVESDTARYFYLRLVDKDGKRTFSPPVWCGRKFDVYKEPKVKKISPRGFSAVDEISGRDASAVIDFDVDSPFEVGAKKSSVVVDMKKNKYLCGVAYVNPSHPPKDKNDPLSRARFHAKFPRQYRISTSLDGVNYVTRSEGGIRTYGGEEIFTFKNHLARYVKFEVLSTVGEEHERKEYMDATLHLGGLILLKKER